mmetsp:Transcript_26204/g.79586  ORF Transcript_26204/g.79586 Transcript_26204/m.79586 type:complete len:302 (+) Transcript_26204:2867-3772(+)|eukprot:scaffold2188_cov32-Tisochrysis_lutea.AAC.3
MEVRIFDLSRHVFSLTESALVADDTLNRVQAEFGGVASHANGEPNRRCDDLRCEGDDVRDIGEGFEVVMASTPVSVPLEELLDPKCIAIEAEREFDHSECEKGPWVRHEDKGVEYHEDDVGGHLQQELDARHGKEPTQIDPAEYRSAAGLVFLLLLRAATANACDARATLETTVQAARETSEREADAAVATWILTARRHLGERLIGSLKSIVQVVKVAPRGEGPGAPPLALCSRVPCVEAAWLGQCVWSIVFSARTGWCEQIGYLYALGVIFCLAPLLKRGEFIGVMVYGLLVQRLEEEVE